MIQRCNTNEDKIRDFKSPHLNNIVSKPSRTESGTKLKPTGFLVTTTRYGTMTDIIEELEAMEKQFQALEPQESDKEDTGGDPVGKREDFDGLVYEYDDSVRIKNYTTSFDLNHSYDKPDIRNVKYLTPTDHLQCPICQQPFIKPLTTLCGHTFCKECIFECFKMSRELDSDSVGLCPLDRTPIDSSNSNDIFPTPILINNLVDELRVSCLNTERGCDWTGCRWQLEHHAMSECDFTGVKCNGLRHNGEICHLIVERRYLHDEDEDNTTKDGGIENPNSDDKSSDDEANEEEDEITNSEDQETQHQKDKSVQFNCIHKLYECKYCKEKVTKISESNHLETECLFNYQTCELCNNDMIPLKSLSHHREYCSKNSKFICPAKEIGCKFVGSNEPSLENHLLNNCQLHNFLPVYQQLNNKINGLSDDNKYLQKQINLILDLIVQGKITNLGYNEPIEEINRFKNYNDADQDKLIYLNYEIERLKYQMDEKMIPFINKQTNEREPIMNNLVNDNFMMKDDLNLQRMLINSLRKQIQFILFKNHRPTFNGMSMSNPIFDDDLSDSEERLNLKL